MKSNNIIAFGQTIRYLRIKSKISQETLAAKTGFHRTYIGMIERGERNPSLKNIAIFANVFGMSISELFKLSEKLLKK